MATSEPVTPRHSKHTRRRGAPISHAVSSWTVRIPPSAEPSAEVQSTAWGSSTRAKADATAVGRALEGQELRVAVARSLGSCKVQTLASAGLALLPCFPVAVS